MEKYIVLGVILWALAPTTLKAVDVVSSDVAPVIKYIQKVEQQRKRCDLATGTKHLKLRTVVLKDGTKIVYLPRTTKSTTYMITPENKLPERVIKYYGPLTRQK